MQCTIPRLIDAQPNRPRTFRAFVGNDQRTIRKVAKFAQKMDVAGRKAKIRATPYGWAVNYYGNPRKPRVKLQPARLVMWHGFSFNRRLPVPLA